MKTTESAGGTGDECESDVVNANAAAMLRASPRPPEVAGLPPALKSLPPQQLPQSLAAEAQTRTKGQSYNRDTEGG